MLRTADGLRHWQGTHRSEGRVAFEILLWGKATGAFVTIADDSSGDYCDRSGHPAPTSIDHQRDRTVSRCRSVPPVNPVVK